MENGKSRLQKTQEDVEEVKEIMLDNLKKADVRKEKLTDLEDRADVLMEQGKTFEKKTNQVKQKQKGENKKMKLIFIGIGVAVAILIIGVIIFVSVQ